jgi:O-antigen/teichoic acid export membrane protein
VRPLFGYGGWVTLTSIISPLLSTFDRVIIGAVAGVGAVTHYTVPFSLASRISILPGSMSSALFPRFSALDDERRDVLFGTAVRALAVLITPLAVGGMLIMEPFLAWWVGAGFAAKAAPVGEILTIGLWANCLAYLPFGKLQGQGRPDLVAKFHLAELLPYLAVLWLALEWNGAIGAAIAWSLRVWADAALLFWASRFRQVAMLAGGAVALAAAGVMVVLTSGREWHGFAARSAFILVVVGWAWWKAPAEFKNWPYQLFGWIRRRSVLQA